MNAIVSKLALVADAPVEHTTIQADVYNAAGDGELEIEVVPVEANQAPEKIRHSVELLYTPSESIFAAAAPDMVDRGWSVFPQEINRRPGTVYGEMIQWSKKHDLQNKLPTPETMRVWRHHCSTLNVACVFGPASGNTFAIDIDVLDEDMSYAIENLAEEMLGETPLRRVGMKPKIAMIYRTAPGDEMKSYSRWIANADDKASEHGIEILGAGKLLTFHGRHHKTGGYFKWSKNPQMIGPEEAPLVTTQQVADFMSAVDQIYGFAVAGSMKPIDPSGVWTSDGDYIQNGEKKNDGREATLTRLVSTIATSFNPAFWDAKEAGQDALMEYRNAKLIEICTEFAKGNELSGRWAEHRLEGEARERLDRWIAKISLGRRPPESKMQREKADKPALDGWKAELLVNDKGQPKSQLTNALVALEKAPEWAGVLAFDLFAGTIVLAGRPPYDRGEGEWITREVVDNDMTWTADWLQRQGIAVGADIAMSAISAVADIHKFHPVRDYLNSLVWDNKPRIDSWLIDHAGAEDVRLNCLFGSKFLIGAVARVMHPGCKLDTMLILEGRQGMKKSSVFEILAGRWFTDQLPDIGSKDAQIQLQGVWILEHAEMSGMSKSDTKEVKAFMTIKSDRYRSPFGKVSENHPRQVIFGGTVNPGANGYLMDETGNRRFWPVMCGVNWTEHQQVDAQALADVRDQLWAEAVVRYQAGESWYLQHAEDEAAQAEAASLRAVEDVWQGKVQAYVSGKQQVKIEDILYVGLARGVDSWSQADAMRVGRIMSMLGWTKKAVRLANGDREKRYFSPLKKVEAGSQEDASQ